MNYDEIRSQIKAQLSCADYLRKSRGSLYCCPFCGSGNGKNQTGALQVFDSNTWYCHKCGAHGDVIDLYQKENGVDHRTAVQEMAQKIGAERGSSKPIMKENRENNTKAPAAETPIKKDFSDYFSKCSANIKSREAAEYLSFRGISEKTALRFGLGYDVDAKALIVPVSNSFYIARSVLRDTQKRYLNPPGAAVEIFNKAALKGDEPVFIVEGTIDALSIIEAGGEAIGLNGVGNINKLLAAVGEIKPLCTLILCLDNDEAGRAASKRVATALRELNAPFIEADITNGHKDPNEALTADYTRFALDVAIAAERTKKPDNTLAYIFNDMEADTERLKAQGKRKTGFPNLDRCAGGIYSGLYVLGGISSVGKTTFISQLADQMAEQGQHVLFFSMEQSRFEIVTKSISRQTAKIDPDKAVCSLQIREGAKGESITRAFYEYQSAVNDRVSIIEGNFNCTVSFIGEYTRRYIDKNKVRPIVFIDYLQVIQAEKDPETGRKSSDTKQIVDYNVTQLKRMSRSLDIPVFVVSSVNRGNYLAPMDFESFKESGGIEYTADVVWGLQLAIINNQLFNDEKKIKEKREMIGRAKEAIPRDIELVCLKNRYGRSRYTAQFTYYPQYDYFCPNDGFTEYTGPNPFEEDIKRL